MTTSRVIPETPPDFDKTRVLERPNGFYWQSTEDAREFGPFASLLEAVQDMQRVEESPLEPGETLKEVEDEIGVANWIDPDTGEPAEEDGTRTEQH